MKVEVVLEISGSLHDDVNLLTVVGVQMLEFRRDIEFEALPEVGQEIEFTEGAHDSKERDNTGGWEGTVDRVYHQPLAGDGKATIEMVVKVTALGFMSLDDVEEFNEVMEGLGWKLAGSWLHKETKTSSEEDRVSIEKEIAEAEKNRG